MFLQVRNSKNISVWPEIIKQHNYSGIYHILHDFEWNSVYRYKYTVRKWLQKLFQSYYTNICGLIEISNAEDFFRHITISCKVVFRIFLLFSFHNYVLSYQLKIPIVLLCWGNRKPSMTEWLHDALHVYLRGRLT